MKRILVLVFVLFCATVYNTSAQSDDCELPYGCSWNGPSTVILYDCLTVQYYYTICNGKAYFRIGDITVEPPCVPYGPGQIIYDAGEAILKEPWLDQIRDDLLNVDDCSYDISQYSSECYYRSGPNPSEPDQLVACHGETCCIGTWRICKTGINPDTFSYTKTNNHAVRICERPLEPGCFPVCE